MKKLKEGYTTGSCATAAAMAAVRLLAGLPVPDSLEIPLPPQAADSRRPEIRIPINRAVFEGKKARAAVIKDGGDDPDATHGASIEAVVELLPGHSPLTVQLEGGKGVGRTTLPGLPVEVGNAAINPAPRSQIISGVMGEMRKAPLPETGILLVTIEVPRGEEIAARTMNPKLGIVGGISILGTQGIVRPYSHASWKASISQALDVAAACGHRQAVFTTGRRSQRIFSELCPEVPEQCIIQAADFFRHSILAAARKGFKTISWSLFFGKLVKHAQGYPYTHAKDWKIDFNLLAKWCRKCSLPAELCQNIPEANTARQVLQATQGLPEADSLYKDLISKATRSAQDFCHDESLPVPEIKYYLFDFEEKILFAPGRAR